MCTSGHIKKEILHLPQWERSGSIWHWPSIFQYSYGSTSLAGALRTAEYILFASRTPPLGDAVSLGLPIELAVFGTHTALLKIQYVLESRENIYFYKAHTQIQRKKEYNQACKCYSLNGFWLWN